MRVPPDEFRTLPLEAHAILADVPLHDVSAVVLPGGGPGRTVPDVRALLPDGPVRGSSPVVAALFALRLGLGRLLGWDRPQHAHPEASYLPRVSAAVRARSLVPPGTVEDGFRVLYVLDGESLAEIHNATVHAFLCTALRPHPTGHRLYWAVYVKPTSWLTPIYMAAIEPFRRFVVYPALLRRLRRAWVERYPQPSRA